jgi:hypothetical protein
MSEPSAVRRVNKSRNGFLREFAPKGSFSNGGYLEGGLRQMRHSIRSTVLQ